MDMEDLFTLLLSLIINICVIIINITLVILIWPLIFITRKIRLELSISKSILEW